MRPLAALAGGVFLAAVAMTGCSGSREPRTADKAGGSRGIVVLRLGAVETRDSGDLPALAYFARQVEELSAGRVRIHTTWAAAGLRRHDAAQQLARMVRQQELDLGYAGAEGWDELGVMSFAGVFAPLLVDSDPLLNAIAGGSLAAKLLGGLERAGVVGLALIPRSLGPAEGRAHEFLTPGDFSGARVAVMASKTVDKTLRALGARPVHASIVAMGTWRGGVDAQFPAYDRPPVAGVVAANVPLLPRLNTLFANRDSLKGLSRDQRLAVRRAAARTRSHVIATRPTAQSALEAFCSTGRGASPTGGGRAVLASRSELAALRRATRPVYARLRRDPRTKDVIERIGALKRSLASAPVLQLPAGCSAPTVTQLGGGKPRPPGALNGTYRWLLTRADAIAFGRGANNADTLAELPSVVTMTLRDGKWQFGAGPDAGTYTATAHRISFRWPAVNSVLTFAYSSDPDGALHLRPTASVERGDQFVWSSQPWRRIGPPVRSIP
jgi:TRAP-type C4-dicarboxylate transport system substrate-binding protein